MRCRSVTYSEIRNAVNAWLVADERDDVDSGNYVGSQICVGTKNTDQ